MRMSHCLLQVESLSYIHICISILATRIDFLLLTFILYMFGVSEEVGEDLSKFGVHHLRSGRAKDAANSNIPNRLFKAHERWKSETAKDGRTKDNTDKVLLVSNIFHSFLFCGRLFFIVFRI